MKKGVKIARVRFNGVMVDKEVCNGCSIILDMCDPEDLPFKLYRGKRYCQACYKRRKK